METKSRPDLWYVWFPDGRVLRAAGAAVVRQQLEAGRLPPGTRARRSGEEQWRPIEAYQEFADLAINGDGASHPAPAATIASRVDPTQLRLLGVRAYLDELFAALDSTLVRAKLGAAALAGVALGALAGVATFLPAPFTLRPTGWGWLLAAGAVLVLAGLSAVLTKLTYVELSRLRPARWREGLRGAAGVTLRLALAWLVIGALIGGLIAGARWLPGRLLEIAAEGDDSWRVPAHAAVAAGAALELVLWPLLVLLLALGPVLVVEHCSLGAGVARWARLLRAKGTRLLFAEGLALAVGLVLVAPILLLVWLAVPANPPEELALTADLTKAVLFGLGGAALLAYLLVANVFLYLHLRQGHGDGGRAAPKRR
jgi:hypothetical protein